MLVIPQSNGGIHPTLDINADRIIRTCTNCLAAACIKEDLEKKTSNRDSPVGGACHAGTICSCPGQSVLIPNARFTSDPTAS